MSIQIGKHIRAILTSDSTTKTMLGGRLFPIVAPEGANGYPYAVYETTEIVADYTADGLGREATTATIEIVSKSYEETIRTAEAVRRALELRRAKYEDFEIRECEMEAYGEGYDVEICVYFSNLSFKFINV